MYLCHVLLGGLLQARFFMAANALSYPATLELDIVFPRNDTYALVSPFPVVFAMQNADAFWDLGALLYWDVSCRNGSLWGGYTLSAHFDRNRTSPRAEPYIYVNVSDTGRALYPGGGAFPLWSGDRDACKLDWRITYVEECTLYPNRSVLWTSGFVKVISGSVNFSVVASGGKLPADQLRGYTDCPLYGGSVIVEDLLSTWDPEPDCPHFGRSPAAANPCAVSFAGLASSALAQIATPTATLVPTTTQSSSSTTSTSAPTPLSGGITGIPRPNTASSREERVKESTAVYLFLSLGFLGRTLFL